MSIKPIHFNLEMVRAILDGSKTVTRRVIKPQPDRTAKLVTDNLLPETTEAGAGGVYCFSDGTVVGAQYQIGDILWVRETILQGKTGFTMPSGEYAEKWTTMGGFEYIADGADPHWSDDSHTIWMQTRPSIHMPKEAARIFLRVTLLNAQRVQNITDEQAHGEGCKDRAEYARVWNDCYAMPQPVKENGVIVRYESYPWEDIQETRTYRGLPWKVFGNPWVWVIEFERCEKPEEWP